MIRHGLGSGLASVLFTLIASVGAYAQDVLPRQLKLVVGYGPGGGYDAYARVIARHMGKYLPGAPTISVQNMPGAASLRAANFIYASAPRDGSTFGTVSRDSALIALLGDSKSVRFDPLELTWLGSASTYEDDTYLLWLRKGVASNLKAARQPGREIIIGVTGDGGGGNDIASFARDALGIPVKIVTGYPDSSALFLAIERSELDGRFVGLSAVKTTQQGWLAEQSAVAPIVQFARRTRHPSFPDVPLARELGLSQRDEMLLDLIELPFALSKPYIAPPALPPSVAKALQDGFRGAMQDKELLAEFERFDADVSPIYAADVMNMLQKIQKSPEDVKARMRSLMQHAK